MLVYLHGVFLTIAAIMLMILWVRKRQKKPISKLYFIALMAIIVIWPLGPTLGPILTFDSVESAYSFQKTDSIVDVIYGEESALVIGKQSKTSVSLELLLLRDGKWKWPFQSETSRVFSGLHDSRGTYVCLLNYKQDSYIAVGVLTENATDTIKVDDSLHSHFICLTLYERNGRTSLVHSAYIHDFPNDYSLNINGKALYATDKKFKFQE